MKTATEYRPVEIERLVLAHHRALQAGTTVPEIAEGVLLAYAPVMADTLEYFEKSGRDADYRRLAVHALLAIHQNIKMDRSYRDAMGLPLSATPHEITRSFLALDHHTQRRVGAIAEP